MTASNKFAVEPAITDKASPSLNDEGSNEVGAVQNGALKKVTRISSAVTVLVAGLALFSDGYSKSLNLTSRDSTLTSVADAQIIDAYPCVYGSLETCADL